MIWILRGLFLVILVSMLGVTGWASAHTPLWSIPSTVSGHPWFIATLVDAYWGFITFYCWVVYKERKLVSRLAWLVGILLLGNIAMALYMLIQLARVPAHGRVEDVLLRRS